MGKKVHDNVLDAALNLIKTTGNRVFVCTTEPANFAEANGALKLASANTDANSYTGPANGDSSGRKITMNQISDITVAANGNAAHVCIGDSANSILLYVTTCTSQTLTANNTVSIPAWDIEIADPT